jgi:uncharacterized protein YidB (DUF937 family)
MSEHEKFEALLTRVGLSRKDLADLLSLKYTSLTNQLAPSKELPRWAKAMLILDGRIDKVS